VDLDIERIAEAGDQYAQACLGCMYGVDGDDSTAVEWYRKAAEQGHANAQNNLGYMYECGFGVDRSYSTAVGWYRIAAEQGYADITTSGFSIRIGVRKVPYTLHPHINLRLRLTTTTRTLT